MDKVQVELLQLTHTAQGVALDAVVKLEEAESLIADYQLDIENLEDEVDDYRVEREEDRQKILLLERELEKVTDELEEQGDPYEKLLYREALRMIVTTQVGDIEGYAAQILENGKNHAEQQN